MKNNDTGEFELVLGNRQLLSAFFVVVILFGVFFTMGYIVGRNSAPATKAAANTESAPASSLTAQTDTRTQAAAPAGQPPAAEAPTGATGATGETQAAEATPQPVTQPVQETPAKAAEEAPAAPAKVTEAEPEPGQTYLQVMAVKRPDAEVVARTLKEKGFSTTLSPARDNLVRVLVGPYADTATLGKAKASLENLGFQPMVRRPAP